MDVIEVYLRVEREDIALIKFVIESYEEFGIVRTVDRKKAVIVLLIVPDFIKHVRAALDSLRQYVDWYEVSRPAGYTDWLLTARSEPSDTEKVPED